MSDPQRAAQISAALEGTLEEGEEFLIRRTADGIEVVRPDENEEKSLGDSQPELYGHLLEVNEQLSGAGSSVILAGMLAVVVLCLAVHMQWMDNLTGIDTSPFRSFWVYGVAVLAAFGFLIWVINRMEARVFARHRDHLYASIRAAGLTRRTLLARIEDDERVKDVAEKLKTGADPDQLHSAR